MVLIKGMNVSDLDNNIRNKMKENAIILNASYLETTIILGTFINCNENSHHVRE